MNNINFKSHSIYSNNKTTTTGGDGMYTIAFLISLADQIGGAISRAAKQKKYSKVLNDLVSQVNGDISKLDKLYEEYQKNGNNIKEALHTVNPFSTSQTKLNKAHKTNEDKVNKVAEARINVQKTGNDAINIAQSNLNNAGTGSLIGDMIVPMINGGAYHKQTTYTSPNFEQL